MDKKELAKRQAQNQIKNYTKKLKEINKDEKGVVERYNEGMSEFYWAKSGSYLRRSYKREIVAANLFLYEECKILNWTPVFEVKPLKKTTKFYQKYLSVMDMDGWCWFSDLCSDYSNTAGWDGMRKSGTLAHQVYGRNIITRKERNPKTNRIARRLKIINP